jgi:hypothetical protein
VEKKTEIKKPVLFFTYCTNSKDLLNGLQDFMAQRTSDETKDCRWPDHNSEPCKGLQTRLTHISEMHLFIDILNWEGIIIFLLY